SAEIIGSHYPDMHCCVKGALSVRHASLLYNAGLCPVRIPLVKQLHGHTVKGRILQDILSIVHKLQRKEVPPLIQQPEEDLVPLPDFHPPYCILFHPFELSLITFNGVSLESVRGVQRHVFHHILSVYKGDQAPVLPGSKRITGLFLHLPEQTFLGTLSVLKMTSHTDPLIVVHIIFLYR